jgi:hypothetical protein
VIALAYRTSILFLFLSCLVSGCGSDTGGTTTVSTDGGHSEATDAGSNVERIEDATTRRSVTDPTDNGSLATPLDTIEPPELAAVAGRFINSDGDGIVDLRVLCCTQAICYDTKTNSNGEFELDDMDPEPIKVQVADPSQNYVWLYFHHTLVAGQQTSLPYDIVLPEQTQENTSWSEETGGVVTVADDTLELEAPPGVLSYPFGADEAVRAERLTIATLPPYGSMPWEDRESATLAYAFYPLDIHSSEPLGLRILQGVIAPTGTAYDFWSVEANLGTLTQVGTGTVDENGVLALDAESTLDTLITVFAVPQQPVEPTTQLDVMETEDIMSSGEVDVSFDTDTIGDTGSGPVLEDVIDAPEEDASIPQG